MKFAKHNLRDYVSWFIFVKILRKDWWITKIFGHWAKVSTGRTL
jgi:hypothetical protein